MDQRTLRGEAAESVPRNQAHTVATSISEPSTPVITEPEDAGADEDGTDENGADENGADENGADESGAASDHTDHSSAPVDAGTDPNLGDTAEAGAPSEPAVPPPCPDLDADGIWDCEQTLLVNAAFDANHDEWSAGDDVLGDWQSNDAEGRDSSGSVLVRNQYFVESDAQGFGGVTQCLSADAVAEYHAGVQVWTPAGQGEGLGGMQILFFGEPDCGGIPIGSQSALTPITEAWHAVGAIFSTPVGTLSMRVGLGSVKPFRLSEFSVFLDNALLHKSQ